MAILTSLPAELQLSILELALPDDLINLAITCKQLWRLAEGPVKQHKALQSQYRSLTPGATRDDHTLWDVLNAIIQNPRIAYYIHSVNLPAERNVYWDSEVWMSNQVRPEHEHPPSEYVELFTAAASAGPLKPDDREDSAPSRLETAIANGSDGPIIALLLPRLPNLKQLTYVDWGDRDWLLDVLKQAAVAYAAPNPPLDFRNLTTVRLMHWDTELCIPYEFVRYLICMPAVRLLCGHMVGGERASGGPLNLARSRVTDLEFSYSALSRGAMADILSGIEALERFTYECGGVMVDYTDYDPRGMVADLLKYAGHSLEELSVIDVGESEPDETSPHNSFAGFQKLRCLTLDWNVLVPDPDEEVEDEEEKDKPLSQGFYTEENTEPALEVNLAGFLPSSLETLKLAECPSTEVDLIIRMLEQKEAKLPKLSKIRIGVIWPSPDDIVKLSKAAEAAGVEFRQYRNS